MVCFVYYTHDIYFANSIRIQKENQKEKKNEKTVSFGHVNTFRCTQKQILKFQTNIKIVSN